MAPPPPPAPARLPSLQEQQQRFVVAQHLMATRAVPPLQQWRPSTQPQAQATSHATTATSQSASRANGTKRRRQRTATPSASISETVDAEPTQTPRKTAHELQKEYRSELAKEARELEERLDQLRLRAGLPTKADKQQLLQARVRNTEIDQKIYTTTRLQVQVQSLVNEQLQRPPVNPLDTHIHLPCDQTQRCAILQGMKDVKLNRAAATGVAHFAPLEANGSYMKEERFMADGGVYHCNRWEMNEFPQFKTARQLYDALLFWLYNIEISITEMIGQLTLREDTTSEEITPTIWNQLLITTTEGVGCTEELNVVSFAQFYPNSELLDGEPLGVIAVDTVDVDDLYPYQPHERTRKAFQAYHLMSEVVDAATGHRAVVLKSCILSSQLPPQFPVDPQVVEKLHENMSVWAVVMVQYLRDYVVPP